MLYICTVKMRQQINNNLSPRESSVNRSSMKNLNAEKAISFGLNRFLKVTKHTIDTAGLNIDLKHTHVCKELRTAMSIIAYRLHENIDNCRVTGVKFSKKEAESLNLPINSEKEFGFYYLDCFSKSTRVVLYLA